MGMRSERPKFEGRTRLISLCHHSFALATIPFFHNLKYWFLLDAAPEPGFSSKPAALDRDQLAVFRLIPLHRSRETPQAQLRNEPQSHIAGIKRIGNQGVNARKHGAGTGAGCREQWQKKLFKEVSGIDARTLEIHAIKATDNR